MKPEPRIVPEPGVASEPVIAPPDSANDQPPEHEILETIVDQFTRCLRAGEHPAIVDYQQRYPDLADEIEDLLSSIAMIEQLKSASDTRTDQRQLLDTVSRLTHIGNYKIQSEIGRGGMGVVFAAVHEALGRRVAIKVMPTPLVDGEKYVQRFRHEAQLAARLHHTNIVSVFGVGEDHGFHYYVMDHIDGDSLNTVIARLKTKPKYPLIEESNRYHWAANVAANVAAALAYAHAADILHRDIKPSNMILDHQGTIWITDFGLAKDGSRELNLTRTGDVIGTPQYLAPESLEGQYDQRSETYGVGLMLYELVTLKPAYAAGSPAEVIRAIATRSPTPVKKLDPRIPLDLATIIGKATNREPRLRYQTANELKQDLLAFVEGRPISARRPQPIERLFRWGRRNPLTAALSAISTLLLVLVAVSASIGYWSTMAALDKEAEKSARLLEQQIATEAARREAEQNFLQMKTQHERAESNVAITIDAFDEMFKQVIARGAKSTGELDIDGFREVSGLETSLTKQDAAFLNRLVSFYEKFAVLNADNERLKSESAKAFRRVGNIYQLVGDMLPAINAYEKSLELLPVLTGDSPSDKSDLLTRVQTQNELGAACRQNGAPIDAQEWNRKSIQLLEQSALSKNDPAVRLELARTLSVLGFNLFRTLSINNNFKPLNPIRQIPTEMADLFQGGRRNWERRNLQFVQRAIDIMNDLVSESPDNAEYRSVRATCYCVLAAANIDADRKNGFEIRDRAIKSFDELVTSHPENPEYQYLLALACGLTGTAVHSDDVELLERSADIAQKLIQQFPNLLDYHHLHASLRIKLAGYHRQQQKLDRALQELRSAKSSIEELLAQTPSDRSFFRTMNSLINELQQLSKSYLEVGNTRIAGDINQLARQIRNNMREQLPPRSKN